MATLEIRGKEIPLRLTLVAMRQIEEKCGADISDITNWISKGTTFEKYFKVVEIVRIMANGYVSQHNADIALGIESGEKLAFYDEDIFVNLFEVSDLSNLNAAMYESMSGGMKFTVPDGVKLEGQDDEVLAEIERERAKKEGNS